MSIWKEEARWESSNHLLIVFSILVDQVGIELSKCVSRCDVPDHNDFPLG